MAHNLNMQEQLAVLCDYWQLPDGTHPTDLVTIQKTEGFQKHYSAIMKSGNGDGRSAARAALDRMLYDRKPVSELPVHVIEPDDFDVVWPKGGKKTIITVDKQPPAPDGSNFQRGVRIALPDGATRFLTGVPDEVRAGLKRGQPVKMVGDITMSVNLIEKARGGHWQDFRLGRADLKVEAHKEPLAGIGRLSFEEAFGKSARFGADGKVLPIKEWKGAYRLDTRTNTISLRFGPEDRDGWPDGFLLRAVGTVREASYSDFDDERPVVRLTVEDDMGNKVNTKESPGAISEQFGIPADGDYSPLVGERVILSGHGSIDAIIDADRSFGDDAASSLAKFQSEVDDLVKKGMLVKQKNNDRLQLAFTDEHIAGFDAEAAKTNTPIVPHVIVGDKRVVSMFQTKAGDWKVNGLASDMGRNPWMTCLPDRRGGNKTGFICWLSRVGGKPAYDNSDPLYAALANIPLPQA
jgi:hypothetical protein